MADQKVVLVTGAGDYWGARLAGRLLREPHLRVIGLDGRPPLPSVSGLDFIAADIRNPALGDLLRSERVDVVCHLKFAERVERTEDAYDLNVRGSLALRQACGQAGVGRVIWRSSTAVYGARADNSAFLSEDMPLRGSERTGFTRDLLEMERIFGGPADWQDPCQTAALRFANIVGPTADSPMARYLRLDRPPVPLGFDPMVQFIYEDDVLEALVQAVLGDVVGAINIAADGAMPLSRALRLAGRLPMPVPMLLARLGRRLPGIAFLEPGPSHPIELDYLRYPWVADLSRMRDELSFYPSLTAAEAIQRMAGHESGQADAGGGDETLRDQESLRDLIASRRGAREAPAEAGA
jgi:UDP-glucose 4-epimerase